LLLQTAIGILWGTPRAGMELQIGCSSTLQPQHQTHVGMHDVPQSELPQSSLLVGYNWPWQTSFFVGVSPGAHIASRPDGEAAFGV